MTALEPAKAEELAVCYEIIEMGRAFQQEQGFVQWTQDYPNRETIRGDIAAGKGWVLKVDGRIAGYMCIDFNGEPAYHCIDGRWSADLPYGVVHRLAFHRDFRGRGLAGTAFGLVEELCRARGVLYIRADTDFPNRRMQHVLTKCGYTHCGTVLFQGSGKMAYDKLLSEL